MLVDNIHQAIRLFRDSSILSLDTETFGLGWYDKLFSIIISDGEEVAYLNFGNHYTIPMSYPVIPYEDLKHLQSELLANPNIYWFLHNAKYDMRRLQIEGCEIMGFIHCTQQMERYVRNNYLKYSLDACLKRRGKAKNDEVKKWCDDNGAYTMVSVPGRKKKDKNYHYDKVPFDLIVPYGCDDALDTHWLGMQQLEYFKLNPDLQGLVNNESELTKAVFRMESRGIKVDREFCERQYIEERRLADECIERIEELTGKKYKTGPLWLTEVMNEQGVTLTYSEKGNPIFNENALKNMDNAIAATILEMRGHVHMATSFYSAYLRMSVNDGAIHPTFNIGGTDTGRFSGSNPNIQQVPKEEDLTELEANPVRAAFIPREDCILVAIDYDQMEYRLMADYAGEHEMIAAIMEGMDPHNYVAEMMSITRKPAKTMNFGLLYGMGLAALAKALKVDMNEAGRLKRLYYSKLRRVEKLFERAKERAAERGYIFNSYGRRSWLDDIKFAYKLVNYLIQGTGADVVRHVMPKIDKLLLPTKSGMIIQAHDELVFEIHKTELHLIPEIKRLMEVEYKPFNGMTLTAGVSWSHKSWAQRDMIDGIPTEEDLRRVA